MIVVLLLLLLNWWSCVVSLLICLLFVGVLIDCDFVYYMVALDLFGYDVCLLLLIGLLVLVFWFCFKVIVGLA